MLIDNPRQLAAFYAKSVTAEATSSSHWVAKNGDSSLFKILQRMLPEVRDLDSLRVEICLWSSAIYFANCNCLRLSARSG